MRQVSKETPIMVLIAVAVTALFTTALVVWLVTRESPARASEPPPTVARICKSGDHIFHYADGTNRTGFGYVITEPDLTKVCE